MNRISGWNPGGGRLLRVLPLIAVATLVGAAVTPLKGTDWTPIYATSGTLDCVVDEADTDAGITYTVTIKCFHPSDSPALGAELQSLLKQGRLLAEFTDNGGTKRLIGTPAQGLTLTYKFGTDPDVPGSRGYTFTLMGTFSVPPTYVV